MTKGEKEIADLVGTYTDKLLKITEKTEKSIQTLKKIKDEYDTKWWKNPSKFLPWIYPIFILIVLYFMAKYLNCNTHIAFQGIEISRVCKP